MRFFWTTLPTSSMGTNSAQQFQNSLAALGPNRRVWTDIDCYRSATPAGTPAPAGGTPVVALGIVGNSIQFRARSRDMIKGFAEGQLQNPILFRAG